MARMTVEEKLAAVAGLEREGAGPEAWKPWLQDAQNLVVARAAEAVARLEVTDAIPLLVAAFFRLVQAANPVNADKLCRAKGALVQALDALRNPDPEPYLAGLRHVQMEPVYGGREDTAADLRGFCATALARMHYFEAHFAIAPLLFDAVPAARTAAINALAYLVGEKSELLLRMKIIAGDDEPEVLASCFAGLLRLEPERSLPFVGEFLHAEDRQRVELAALALGNARLEEAFPLLRACWEANSDFDLRPSLLLAMALTRSEEAFTYLLGIMRDEGNTIAVQACDALAIYGVDRRYRERIEAVVAECRNPRLVDAFSAHFPPGP